MAPVHGCGCEDTPSTPPRLEEKAAVAAVRGSARRRQHQPSADGAAGAEGGAEAAAVPEARVDVPVVAVVAVCVPHPPGLLVLGREALGAPPDCDEPVLSLTEHPHLVVHHSPRPKRLRRRGAVHARAAHRVAVALVGAAAPHQALPPHSSQRRVRRVVAPQPLRERQRARLARALRQLRLDGGPGAVWSDARPHGRRLLVAKQARGKVRLLGPARGGCDPDLPQEVSPEDRVVGRHLERGARGGCGEHVPHRQRGEHEREALGRQIQEAAHTTRRVRRGGWPGGGHIHTHWRGSPTPLGVFVGRVN